MGNAWVALAKAKAPSVIKAIDAILRPWPASFLRLILAVVRGNLNIRTTDRGVSSVRCE